MKSYEIGDEIIAVVMAPVEAQIEGINAPTKANTAIRTKIVNRTEPDAGDPGTFLYEIENHEGAVRANFVFEDAELAKQKVFDSIKHDKIREVRKKELSSLV